MGIMIQEDGQKLRQMLINNKSIVDYEDDDPFVSIYFNELCRCIDELWSKKHTSVLRLPNS